MLVDSYINTAPVVTLPEFHCAGSHVFAQFERVFTEPSLECVNTGRRGLLFQIVRHARYKFVGCQCVSSKHANSEDFSQMD